MTNLTEDEMGANPLAFISLKMEVHWRSNPIGKVQKNLPFFKKLVDE